ncbi:MAG: CDP-alcohol phosphatidyltransferase family protein [Pseudomonadota bacterium]
MSTSLAKHWFSTPNLISYSRVVLLLPLGYGIFAQAPVVSFVCFSLIVISDIYDGKLARRAEILNPNGTRIDHSADAIVVGTTSAILAHQHVALPILPVLIALAFLQYIFDGSNFGREPRASKLGKINGIAYYGYCAICLISFHVNFSNTLIENFVITSCGWILVATTCASIYFRLRQSYSIIE